MPLIDTQSKCLLCGAICDDRRAAEGHLRAVHQVAPGEDTVVGDPFAAIPVPAYDAARPSPGALAWVGLAGPRH